MYSNRSLQYDHLTMSVVGTFDLNHKDGINYATLLETISAKWI